jgi:hypothetical protein
MSPLPSVGIHQVLNLGRPRTLRLALRPTLHIMKPALGPTL